MAQFSHGIVQCATDLEHLYRIYSIPNHGKQQWLLLQFIVLLMMDAQGVRNMWSILLVFNKEILPELRLVGLYRNILYNL